MEDDLNLPEYKVGYCQPPRHTQFRKGRSGNPKGRPKGSRNFESLVELELKRKIEVRENGQPKRISKLELSAKQLANGAAAGKLQYIQFVQPIMERLRVQEERRQALAEKRGEKPDLRYYVEFIKVLKE